ncbi:hypothetical protein M404DRAFT_220501 [Pisolithus tinctorius Marx 270]|uniref:Uncharacterized protein n=1 Tax=Pisolithus tinctorius Marx 270 TaxID=870435 RepID=A0A0C3PNE7_PISTI|nr:hypothetical protein M404DRAFT_220501 [Pisolithus tinctorius Marx 270]
MCACWGKVLVWEGSRDAHRMRQGCQTRVQTSVCAKRKRKKQTMAWKSEWISSVFLVSRDIDTPNDNVRRFGKRKLRSGGTMWEPNYMGAALTWCGVGSKNTKSANTTCESLDNVPVTVTESTFSVRHYVGGVSAPIQTTKQTVGPYWLPSLRCDSCGGDSARWVPRRLEFPTLNP